MNRGPDPRELQAVTLPGPAAPEAAASVRRQARAVYQGRLFRKYLLLILTLVSAALLASGAISVYFTYQETKAALSSLQREKAIAAASRIEQYVTGIEKQLRFAALPQLDASDVELRRIEFLKVLRQAPEVTDIAQLDGAGREQIAVSRLGMDVIGSGKDRSAEPAFRNARRGQTWFGPVYFRKETEPYMTISIRSGGDQSPVTVADVNLKFIWDVVSRIKIGEKGKAYVVDAKGFLVADPDIGEVLRKTDLSTLAHIQATAGPTNPDQPAMESHTLAGTPVLVSVASIDTLGWRVFAEQPLAEVYASLNASILRAVLLLLAGLVLSALAALALARGMVRPIRTLSEGARRIGEGDLDQKIDVRTGDELETLADRFNRMSVQLKESYAGLERKVEERTHELQNSLEQQTAISEILRVISSSPTDVQPVLDAVAQRAAHLCDTPFARVLLIKGDMLYPAASFSTGDTSHSDYTEPVPLDRTSLTGRAAVDRETVHLADVVPLLEAEFPGARSNMLRQGCRAVLAVPLMRESGAYGGIFLFRRQPGLFPPDQVALVETFARQAAIAIDNVRLFNETREALAQQTATAEVLKTISRTAFELQPVLDTLIENATRLCKADKGSVFLRRGDGYEMVASHGTQPEQDAFLSQRPILPGTGTVVGMVAQTGQVVHLDDAQTDPAYTWKDAQAVFGLRSIFGVPMLREGECIGVVVMWRREVRPFTPREQALVMTFADQAVIAIQNVRLLSETKEALEQQQASGEVLAAISSSIADTSPVFETILASCERLFVGKVAVIDLVGEDGLIHLGAYHGPGREEMAGVYPHVGGMDSFTGTAIATRNVVHLPSVDGEAVPQAARRFLAKTGIKAVIGAPMFWEGKGIGAIWVARDVAGAFSDKDVALLRTFADQAVIAIQNARLVNETREALDQQRASGEVLTAISNSIADTKPVFDAILHSCERLFSGYVVGLMLVKDGMLDVGAYHGPGREKLTETYPVPLSRESASGMAILEQRVVMYPDFDAPGVPKLAHDFGKEVGFQSIAAAPLISEGHAIGALWVARAFKGPFNDKHMALLRTFADQAAIAIQNARLVNETREALEQQTATAEVLQVISSSVADTAPVFDKILDSCEHLFATEQLGIFLAEDDGRVHAAAWRGAALEAVVESFPKPLDETITGRVIRERRTVSIPDTAALADPPTSVREVVGRIGHFSAAWAPMLWEDRGVGSIAVMRIPPAPMSDKELTLLKTFADQAVIAIQNARLFREIQEKSRQLEVANKHKSDFLASMSHELRTPLNAIIGFSEVLLERMFGELNEKQDDYMKDIHSSGRHLLSLINDILDLSKVEAGRMELEPTAFDLPSAISNALALVRERAQRHGIALGIEVDPAIGEVVADERKVKQILLNLLSNAVKFTPDGGRIDVSAALLEGDIVVAVRDTGIGIKPEDQETMFEAFRQVGSDYTSKQEGTGLGLALTRKFVELHGGRIWVESAPGTGSTFYFTLPRAS